MNSGYFINLSHVQAGLVWSVGRLAGRQAFLRGQIPANHHTSGCQDKRMADLRVLAADKLVGISIRV